MNYKIWRLLVPQRVSTLLFGWLAECRIKRVKHYLISKFISKMQVNMDEALEPSIDFYENFNAFFSRKLKTDARPLADASQFISPADGFISEFGSIDKDAILQAKGHSFSTAALLADDKHPYQDGSFITVYLAPKDYHRVHTPLNGKLKRMTFIPGKLFSVDDESVGTIENLFARNERIVCEFETEVGPMAIILVGAYNVGSMFTAWHGKVREKSLRYWDYNGNTVLQRGDEVGGFLMGSTAIVLLPKGIVTWSPTLKPGQAVKLGQGLGSLK
jgi:phosphatidylserine decarboxylase